MGQTRFLGRCLAKARDLGHEAPTIKLTRRRLLGAAVLAVAVFAGAWFAFAVNREPPFGVTRSAYRSIRLGMPIEDVERIIGRPADRQQIWPLYDEHSERETDQGLQPDVDGLAWWDDNVTICVSINRDGVVCEKVFEDTLARLLWLARYHWGRLGL